MFFLYMDESGDDGLPGSSPFFVLSTLYLHYREWRICFDALRDFRQAIKNTYGIPTSVELHTMHFMLNKHPFTNMGLTEQQRIEVLNQYCSVLARLPVRAVNVAIHKRRIRNLTTYDVLDTALTYAIQRIDNDMRKNHDGNPFIMIVDEGRLAPMRKTTRKLQRFNYVPSRSGGQATRNDILRMLEDPLTKDSKESYFIQASDLIARIVYMWLQYQGEGYSVRNRTPRGIGEEQVVRWLRLLSPILNLQAHSGNAFGIVEYPK